MKGRKLELKPIIWRRRNKQTFNLNRMQKQELKKKKMKKGLGTAGTTLNVPTSKS